MRQRAIQCGQRATFDILARCMQNSGVKDLTHVMISIFEQDDQLCKDFLGQVIEAKCEPLFELVLDCIDTIARNNVADLFRYLLAKVKMAEREQLLSDQYQQTTSHQLMQMLVTGLVTRAAKNWTRFEKYLELF